MKWDLRTYAERARYRPMAIVLEIASCLAIAGLFIGIPGPLCFIVFFGLSIILTLMTYHRLRNGGFSGAWIWLMIINVGIGPTWHLTDHMTVSLGGFLIANLPVILAWLAPTDVQDQTKTKSA